MIEAAAATGISTAANVLAQPVNMMMNEINYQQQTADAKAMWDLQNLYNHPANQMKRLKEAGLNPNLVYGQSAAGAAGNASEPNRPTKEAFKLSPIDTLGMYQEWRKNEANIELADSQKALNSVKVLTEESLKKINDLRAIGMQFQNDRNERLKEYTDELIIKELEKLTSEAGIADLQEKRLEYLQELRKMGISESDPYWIRMMVGENTTDSAARLKKNLQEFGEFLKQLGVLNPSKMFQSLPKFW